MRGLEALSGARPRAGGARPAEACGAEPTSQRKELVKAVLELAAETHDFRPDSQDPARHCGAVDGLVERHDIDPMARALRCGSDQAARK